MAAIISQQSKIVEQLRDLSGMSSLIGLTYGVTFPTVVDFVDRSTAQLVSYVPRVTPILCQIMSRGRHVRSLWFGLGEAFGPAFA